MARASSGAIGCARTGATAKIKASIVRIVLFIAYLKIWPCCDTSSFTRQYQTKERPQFVSEDRVSCRGAALDPTDVERGGSEVRLLPGRSVNSEARTPCRYTTRT